ncbi:hypothetical protein CXF34_05980 [Corynebacterium bovis]|nr:hypothetical protein CXF34_05980 [Corynebacterium bovis]
MALTILDPVVAAGSQDRAAVAEAHRRILDDTALLGRVTGPGIARVREVVDGGSLIVVVADWVEGAPLPSVAESGPDPLAAGYAVADLADAVALAHGCGTCLGLDHRNRLRISTAGSAVAAFPGVLPGNSPRQDIHGIGVALDLLLANVPEEEVPGALRDLCEEARGVEGVDPHDLARRLREITTGGAGTGDVRDDGDDGVDGGSGGGRGGSAQEPWPVSACAARVRRPGSGRRQGGHPTPCRRELAGHRLLRASGTRRHAESCRFCGGEWGIVGRTGVQVADRQRHRTRNRTDRPSPRHQHGAQPQRRTTTAGAPSGAGHGPTGKEPQACSSAPSPRSSTTRAG